MFLYPNNPDAREYDTIDGGINHEENLRVCSFYNQNYLLFLPWACPGPVDLRHMERTLKCQTTIHPFLYL